jgi:hypothetical protein
MKPMDDNELQFLRTKLKTGEYDGADIMHAWLAIDELCELRGEIARAVAAERDCRTCENYRFSLTSADSCVGAFRCVDGLRYQRNGVARLWDETPF